MKDVVFQQKVKIHDGVLCHMLDGANHVKDYFNKLSYMLNAQIYKDVYDAHGRLSEHVL